MRKYQGCTFHHGESARRAVYGRMAERDYTRYSCPSGSDGGIRKNMGREGVKPRATRRQTPRKYARRGRSGRKDIGVSHSQRTRIGNKVKDIKSSATIRQSLWRLCPCFFTRSPTNTCAQTSSSRSGVVDDRSIFIQRALTKSSAAISDTHISCSLLVYYFTSRHSEP